MESTMKTTSGKLKNYIVLSAAAALAATVMRTVSLITVFESEIGYYARGAILPYVQKGFIALSVLLMLILPIFISKGDLYETRPSPSPFVLFSSFLCGTINIISAVLLLLFQRGSMPTVTLIIIIGFSAGTVFFFYDALCPPEKKSQLGVIPAMIAVIGLIAMIVKIHLDYTITLNSPNKTALFISLATISIFMIQELRFTVGASQPRIYLATSAISSLFCLSTSIPGIIGYYTDTLSGGDFLIYYIVIFAYGVYSISRFISYVKYASFIADLQITSTVENESSAENSVSEAEDQ